MTDFTITDLRILDTGPNVAGTRVLAAFGIDITGIRMSGCILIEKPDGLVIAKGILGKAHKGDKISAQFTDVGLQRAITRRVAEAYTGLTGREVSDE